jgi:replication-associated recombination protein RarA
MNVSKMSDIKAVDSPLRALIYGPAGSGKTTLAGTFPTPMLIFDFDQKLKPLYG